MKGGEEKHMRRTEGPVMADEDPVMAEQEPVMAEGDPVMAGEVMAEGKKRS